MNKPIPLRKQLKSSHPIVGWGYRLLEDHETIEQGDQTARVGLLLSLEFPENWQFIEDQDVGQTVDENIKYDMDRDERVYRRRLHNMSNYTENSILFKEARREALRKDNLQFQRLDEALATPERIAHDTQAVGGFVSSLDLTETAEEIVDRAIARLAASEQRNAVMAVLLDRWLNAQNNSEWETDWLGLEHATAVALSPSENT